jgi:prophage maintenance system killer protein
VTAAFLQVNGFGLDFDDMNAFSSIIGLYENNRMRFRELEEWLRRHVSPV